MLIIDTLAGIFFLFIVIISFGYIFRIFITYLDRSAIYLLLLTVCFDCWVFTRSLFLLESLILFPAEILKLSYFIGNIGLFFYLVGNSFMLNRSVFPRVTRISSMACVITGSMVIAANIFDMVLSQPLFFVLTNNAGIWKVTIHPLMLGLIFLATFFIVSSFFINVLMLPLLSEEIRFQQKKIRNLLIGTLTTCWIIGALIYAGTATLQMVTTNLSFIIVMSIALISSITIFYICNNYPFFFLIIGTQSKLLLEQGHIGYFLASFTDYGPSPILYSSKFEERNQLGEEAYTNFSINGMTALIAYEHVGDRMALIPFPTVYNIQALVFTFYILNQELDDDRLMEGAPTFFSIMFPHDLTWALSNLEEIAPIVWERLRKKKTLSEVSDPDFLEELTLSILRHQML
ncbi:MAG: hypothetical protein ACFFBD_01495 [Candidatus Hodarchaeota archaeon]